jgi:PKHD-type hydroxylase
MSDRKVLNRDYTYYLEPATNSEWAYLRGYFTPEECDKIIALGNSHPRQVSAVNVTNDVLNSLRKGHVVFLKSTDSNNDWIFEKMATAVRGLNKQFWNFDLNFIETLQFSIYDDPNDFYGAHMDMAHARPEARKLSIVVQLSDPADYQGSNLQFHSSNLNFYDTINDRGTLIAFPSYMVHRVTPLTSGIRYSLVSWVCGPPFK